MKKSTQDYSMSFDKLGLRAELLKAVKEKGYITPTPIQTQVIPFILGGRDVLARAQTGTGKTDAFALPMVDILSGQRRKGRHPRALVLAPTRELALQVGECVQGYARKVSMGCTVVYGGVGLQPQVDRLKRGVDILVATPGRLLDLAGQRYLNLSQIEFLVFDEADRMLDMGFSKAISEILLLLPEARRTMLFSATYTREIRDLAAKMLKNPQSVEVSPDNSAADSVEQKVHLVHKENKRALLVHLMDDGDWKRVLVFSKTKHGANKLTEKLAAQGIRAAALHGNKSQSVRTRTLEAFKKDEIRVLVATDVAARGLDIAHLPYVVNYDMPGIPEDYVHRIGRTGRAGVKGIAVSLVSGEDRVHLRSIEKLLGQKITVEKVAGYTEDSAVPAYVMLRPGDPASEKKADREILELVARRAASRTKPKTGGEKAASGYKGPSGRAGSQTGKPTPPAKGRRPPSRSGRPKGQPR
jgi:ATP-dependent RNA helicase RhlE